MFVGIQTQYNHFATKVAFELGIASSTSNPMTAVAEGAAVFAESIDLSQTRGRKNSRGAISAEALDLSFNYIARTPDSKAK